MLALISHSKSVSAHYMLRTDTLASGIIPIYHAALSQCINHKDISTKILDKLRQIKKNLDNILQDSASY